VQARRRTNSNGASCRRRRRHYYIGQVQRHPDIAAASDHGTGYLPALSDICPMVTVIGYGQWLGHGWVIYNTFISPNHGSSSIKYGKRNIQQNKTKEKVNYTFT